LLPPRTGTADYFTCVWKTTVFNLSTQISDFVFTTIFANILTCPQAEIITKPRAKPTSEVLAH
jgi:hypothetical protein